MNKTKEQTRQDAYAKDRAFGDLFLNYCPLTKLHVFQAIDANFVPGSFTLNDVVIEELGDKLDMENGVDCHAYVSSHKFKAQLPAFPGLIQFRCQRSGQHERLNITISDRYKTGRPAELWKSVATTGIFATVNNQASVDSGFSYFVVYDMGYVMTLLKQRIISSGKRWLRYDRTDDLEFTRKYNETKEEYFYTVKLRELARIGALNYVGIDEINPEDGKKEALLGEFHRYPEIANALQSQGFWKKTF